jgi:hypothetical protein
MVVVEEEPRDTALRRKAPLSAPVIVQVAMAPRVRLTKATAQSFGLTEKACRRKMEEGKWVAGVHYHRDPDGNIWLDVKGIMQWVAREPA